MIRGIQKGTMRDRDAEVNFGRSLLMLAANFGNTVAAEAKAMASNFENQNDIVQHIRAAADTTDTFPSSHITSLEEAHVSAVVDLATAIPEGVRFVPSRTRFFVNENNEAGEVVQDGQSLKLLSRNEWTSVVLGNNLRCAGGLFLQTVELTNSLSPVAANAIAQQAIEVAATALDAHLLSDSAGGYFDGVTPLNPTGTTAAQVETDLMALAAALPGSHLKLCRWYLKPATARYYTTLRTSGARTFPDLTLSGGTLLGVPVTVTSNLNCAGSPSQSPVALVNPSRIYLTGDLRGAIQISKATVIDVRASPAGPSQPVSTFQTESAAVKSAIWFDALAATDSVVWMRSNV
jgi:hypothetical protein